MTRSVSAMTRGTRNAPGHWPGRFSRVSTGAMPPAASAAAHIAATAAVSLRRQPADGIPPPREGTVRKAHLVLKDGLVSTSAAQADAFYREVLEQDAVWSIKDSEGFPAPKTPEGRTMPFWSLRSRADLVISTVPAYAGFEAVAIPLSEWRSRWLPGLKRDGVRVGLNWAGPNAMGFDVEPDAVEQRIVARRGSG